MYSILENERFDSETADRVGGGGGANGDSKRKKLRLENGVEKNQPEPKRDVENRSVRILGRRYSLTKTSYKCIDIGITVAVPSRVDIVLEDCQGKEIALSPEMWKEFIGQKQTVLSRLRQQQQQQQNREETPNTQIGDVTLRYGKLNNLPILRMESPIARLTISLNTVYNIFELENCINRIAASLSAITEKVDAKLRRFLSIASATPETANVARAIRESDSFDRNDIVDCELVALYFANYMKKKMY